MAFDRHTELQLLEALEEDPETSQADLAARVGVAVGTVNWYLKRWSKKGYVKVKRIGRWRWRYLLTATGLAEKATLTAKYIDTSMRIYRQARAGAHETIDQIIEAGYDELSIDGDGDMVDIFQLTCMEKGIKVNKYKVSNIPVVYPYGIAFQINWPEAI